MSSQPVEHEVALFRRENNFIDFFENASVPLHWVGPDGVILRANQAELDMMGYAAEEYLGRHIADFHAERAVIDDILARLANRETLRQYPARMRRKDGAIRHVLIHSSALFDGGRFVHTRCITIDVTEQRLAEDALRESETRFRMLANTVPVLIAHCDTEARYKFVNQPYAERFGLRPADLVGRHVAEVLGEETYAAIRGYFETALAGCAVEFDAEIPYKLGRREFVHAAYQPEYDAQGRVIGVFAAIVNMSDRKRAENALRDSEERYRRLAELLPVAVYTCEAPSGAITYYNGKAKEIWGRAPALGAPEERYCGSMNLFLPDGTNLPHAECPMATALHEGRAFRDLEVVIERPDGSRVPVLVNIDPVMAADGTVAGAVNVFHDMTALKKAQQALRDQKESLQALLDSLPLPVFIAHDTDCRRISGNHAAATLLRLGPDSNLSKTAPAAEQPSHFRVMKEGAPLAPEELPIQRAARGEAVHAEEVDTVFDDGSVMRVLVSARPLYDESGRPRGAVANMLDITQRKNAELALREADRRKDEFLATLSHELRNPLAPIRAALSILSHTRDDPVRVDEMKALMERQLEQLIRLIDDLLDVTRISRGSIQLRRQHVDLGTLIRQALETSALLGQGERHSVELALPEQPIVLDADPVRLSQVFSNLLNNARKYTPDGGTIRIAAERREAEVVLSIKDSGIGIAPAELEKVFEMFSQLTPASSAQGGGLGIGLSLARRLVELHGGTLRAYSEGQGCGSEFVVRLPLVDTEASGDMPAAAIVGGPDTKRRILVVDDNADAADTLAVLLGLHGHDVRTANDGRQALERAAEFRPHVLLLDIGLPHPDGYEVCRSIRREPWGRDVMVVALTGWGQEEDRRRSREAGFDAHLVKPVEPEVLARLVAQGTA